MTGGERRTLYVTFGTQYGDLVDAQAAIDAGREPKNPHPTADWATGGGYLAVEYGLSMTDVEDEYIAAARTRAVEAVSAWLNYDYATTYDEPPEPVYAPRGEVAFMVLP